MRTRDGVQLKNQSLSSFITKSLPRKDFLTQSCLARQPQPFKMIENARHGRNENSFYFNLPFIPGVAGGAQHFLCQMEATPCPPPA